MNWIHFILSLGEQSAGEIPSDPGSRRTRAILSLCFIKLFLDPMIGRSGRILPDGLPYGLPIMNQTNTGMRSHEIEAKKNRHYRRLFLFGGGLNGRDCDAKDQGNNGAGRNERGDHGPVVVAFYAER